MKKTLLTAASLMAITASYPAMAEMKANNEASSAVKHDPATITKEDIKEGINDTKKVINNAVEEVKDVVAADDQNNVKVEVETYVVTDSDTAGNLIGQPVLNEKGERVAKIHDIILDSMDNATHVILADGAFTGWGKLVAYDYSMLTKSTVDGDVLAPLTEKDIDKAASFVYSAAEIDDMNDGERSLVMPAEAMSVQAMLDGKLVSADGKALAGIEDIVIVNGRADSIIISYDQILGMGGDQAILPFFEADPVKNSNGQVDFKLTAQETAAFKTFTKTSYQ